MKKQLTTFLLVLMSVFGYAQEKNLQFKTYTLSEFFQMIENNTSDTLEIKNVNIVLDTLTDREFMMKRTSLSNMVPIRKDSLHIEKPVFFENVFMQRIRSEDKYGALFNNIVFRQPVNIKNSSLSFSNVHFLSTVRLEYRDAFNEVIKLSGIVNSNGIIQFSNSAFELTPSIWSSTTDYSSLSISLWMEGCTINEKNIKRETNWFLGGFDGATITGNTITNKGSIWFSMLNGRYRIDNNDFGQRMVTLFIGDIGLSSLNFTKNTLNKTVLLTLPESAQNIEIDWNQFSAGIIDTRSYGNHIIKNKAASNVDELDAVISNQDNINAYVDSVRIRDHSAYKAEVRLLGSLQAIYKKQYDMESANASYIALKDLETQRLAYLYTAKPSFKRYFKWKVNQFLKLFSDYGTEPSKAIVVSVYVILCFAFIYLLFPNTWDKHGRKRIIDRYTFFLKYMDKEAGIHEVYIEEQAESLLEFEEFKTFVNSKQKKVPKIFTATALPLYKWAVSGTKLSASLLKRVDIMKGTWSELPQHKRIWKSILLIGAFLIAIIYDIAIKILNALMLSINTFTTLGFGEIPIKGLPRYLAIIQGFIGWFMLTIFSVSLISQLLN